MHVPRSKDHNKMLLPVPAIIGLDSWICRSCVWPLWVVWIVDKDWMENGRNLWKIPEEKNERNHIYLVYREQKTSRRLPKMVVNEPVLSPPHAAAPQISTLGQASSPWQAGNRETAAPGTNHYHPSISSPVSSTRCHCDNKCKKPKSPV